MNYRFRRYTSYQALPERYEDLLAVASGKGFFYQREWFEFLMSKYYSEESEMCLLFAERESDGFPLLFLPLRLTRSDGAVLGARALTSIGHMENYSPINLVLSPELDELKSQALMVALFRELVAGSKAMSLPPVDVLRLWPAQKASQFGEQVYQAMRAAGFYVQSYDNSFNQYEETAGLDYEMYFGSRSSNHRYNVRRRKRNLEKQGDVQFRLCTDSSDAELLQSLMDGYILSSVASWKEPASMVSKGLLDLIRLTAELGCARLGVLYLNGRPVAAQFWIISGGVASCLRLGYDEQFKKEAPGVVLTGYMIEHLLNEDSVECLDFGYGDDEYKKKWTRDSRYYVGYMGFNRSTWRGRYFAFKHIVGRKIKRGLKHLLGYR